MNDRQENDKKRKPSFLELLMNSLRAPWWEGIGALIGMLSILISCLIWIGVDWLALGTISAYVTLAILALLFIAVLVLMLSRFYAATRSKPKNRDKSQD